MRTIQYENKNIRMSEDTWELLKSEKSKHGKTWNLFLVELLKRKRNKNK